MSPVLVVGAARSDERLPDIEEEMLKEVPHRGEAARFTIQSRDATTGTPQDWI
jgi:hypothetical protein